MITSINIFISFALNFQTTLVSSASLFQVLSLSKPSCRLKVGIILMRTLGQLN